MLVDVDEQRARLCDHAPARNLENCVHLDQVQKHAAGQRHGLAVIAGSRASRGHGDAELVGRREHRRNLRLGLRRDDEIGGHRLELALQNGRIPVEVATLLLHQDGIVLALDWADQGAESGDVVGHAHGKILQVGEFRVIGRRRGAAPAAQDDAIGVGPREQLGEVARVGQDQIRRRARTDGLELESHRLGRRLADGAGAQRANG